MDDLVNTVDGIIRKETLTKNKRKYWIQHQHSKEAVTLANIASKVKEKKDIVKVVVVL